MKSLLLFAVVLLSARVAAQSAHDVPNQNRFVGAWKLVSLKEPRANGQLHKVDCAGLFVFTSDGKASVQVMYRNAESGSDVCAKRLRGVIRQLPHRRLLHFYVSHRGRTCANAHRQRPEAQVRDCWESPNREIYRSERTLGSCLAAILECLDRSPNASGSKGNQATKTPRCPHGAAQHVQEADTTRDL
jgi:hypothetical protein